MPYTVGTPFSAGTMAAATNAVRNAKTERSREVVGRTNDAAIGQCCPMVIIDRSNPKCA